jgi:hypothetical protein
VGTSGGQERSDPGNVSGGQERSDPATTVCASWCWVAPVRSAPRRSTSSPPTRPLRGGGLAAGGGKADLLDRQRAQTGVTNVAVADPAAADRIGGVTYSGPDAVTRLVENTEADVVLNALVGALGLRPTLAALQSGARLALANKESLIAGGPLVLKAAAPGQIVPVDSEHSALAQCLRGGSADEVARLVLTASGGPFRGWAATELEHVTPSRPAPTHLVHGPDEHAELGVAGEQGP